MYFDEVRTFLIINKFSSVFTSLHTQSIECLVEVMTYGVNKIPTRLHTRVHVNESEMSSKKKMLRDVQASAMWKAFVYPRFNNSKLIPPSQVAELSWRITSDDLSLVRLPLSSAKKSRFVIPSSLVTPKTRNFYSIRDVRRPVLSGEPEKRTRMPKLTVAEHEKRFWLIFADGSRAREMR